MMTMVMAAAMTNAIYSLNQTLTGVILIPSVYVATVM
jgi:hypothetical protein